MLEVLSDGQPKGFGAFTKTTAPLWPKDEVPQRDMMIYEILRDLHLRGVVDFTSAENPGVLPDTIRVQKQVYLVDK